MERLIASVIFTGYTSGMYEKAIAFVKYNNAFTFIVASVFFGGGVSFAANPAMREAIYSSEETVVSVDNGMIMGVDLDAFDFNLKIDAVTEDENKYYAAYSYRTLAVEDGVWREREISKTLTASKEALDGGDFGLYAARELAENINYELSYLKRVKKSEEEKGESKKVVTVEYSGLIGKLLDPKEMVIEGYNPVIVPEEVVPPAPADPIISDDAVPAPAPSPEPEPSQSPVSGPVMPEVPPITPVVSEEVLPSASPIVEPSEPSVSEASAPEASPVPVVVPDPVTPPSEPDPATQ